VIRLPNARSPTHQRLFRLLRGLLPRLFSAEEHTRYVKDFYSLLRATVFNGLYLGAGGTVCTYPDCTGAPHDTVKYYDEVAEAFLGRVFMWADRPEQLKRELVKLLHTVEHAAVSRSKGSSIPPKQARDLYFADTCERMKRQRT
jgi:hypothetical protein